MTEIFICRHTDRLDKSKEKDYWFKGKRIKENPWDSPLSSTGIYNSKRMADKLMKKTDMTTIKYLYSSPISRCMETAINIVEKVYKKTGHKIYIRVEYGLTEPLINFYTTVYFEGDKIKSIPIPEEKNGKKYYTKIDKKLYPSELKKKYKNYLDTKYKSCIDHKDVTGGSETINIKRAIKAIKKIIKKNTVIITHGTITYWAYQYICQNKPSLTMCPKKFTGRKNTGVMVGFKIQKGKIPGKLIYKPNNKY